jgi:hypothetical protein
VYLYISEQFVDPVKPVVAQEEPKKETAPKTGEVETPGLLETRNPDGTTKTADRPANPNPVIDAPEKPADGPASQPVPQVADNKPAEPAASQPTLATLEAEFDRLETAYGEIALKPLEDQPVEELLDGYKKLAASNDLSESIRRICDFKTGVLSNRVELKKDLLGTRAIQESNREKLKALQGEADELKELVKKSQIEIYTAVGTLRTSSLQQGEQMLYRLTDPANGRTVVYIRSNDNRIGQYIGQFLGVRGDVEPQSPLGLKIVAPSTYETVNPTKVGQSIAAQFVPPSLMPGPNRPIGTMAPGNPTGTASSND